MGDRKLGYFVANKLDDALQHLQQAAVASSKAEHYLTTRPVNIDLARAFNRDSEFHLAHARLLLTEARYQKRSPGT